MKQVLNWAIVVLIALAFTVTPGGEATLQVALTLLFIAFFTALAFFGYRLFRENRFTLDAMAARERTILYGSIGLAFVNFAALDRLFDLGIGGVFIWLSILGACSYGVYWSLTHTSRYG
jgi:hypothetical protein